MSLLGIDIGTSTCKAAVFSDAGACLAQASREYQTHEPEPGQFELDSSQVWQQTQEAIAEVARGVRHDPITALCVSSFGETMAPVSRRREILDVSILCADCRGAEYVRALEDEIGQEAFYRINPNLLGPQYSLPKLLWLRNHAPDLFQRTDYFLLWADCIGYLLGGEALASNSLANRTLLFDVQTNDWSDGLLEWSGLDRGKLGRVVSGGTLAGVVSDDMARKLGLPLGVRIVAGGHDQCMNALGCGVVDAGTAVCGMGTFECITPTFEPIDDPLAMLAQRLSVEHHALPNLYVTVLYNQAGSIVRWFRDTFAASEARVNDDIYGTLNAELPREPTDLLVLPHFDPVQWPSYLGDTAGAIVGLHTRTTRGEILKAIMECSTLYFVDGVNGLDRLGIGVTEFTASGGGARSDAWLQINADILGVPFTRNRITEGGVVGAVMLAGLATGVYSSPREAAATFITTDRTFVPDTARHAIYQEKHARYNKLYPALADLLAQRP